MRFPCTRIRNKVVRASAKPSLGDFPFFPGDASHVATHASQRQLSVGIPKSSLIITNNSASIGAALLFSALLRPILPIGRIYLSIQRFNCKPFSLLFREPTYLPNCLQYTSKERRTYDQVLSR